MKAILLLFLPLFSFANYLSIGESGETLAPSSYRLGGSLQTLSAGKGGLNVGGFLDAGWRDDLSSRFLFGLGSVEFQMGASLKYVPFPDYAQQPAIGVRTTYWLTHTNDTNVSTIQIAPLVSKKIQIDKGNLTSYLALPINLVFVRDNNHTGTQFTMGAEYEHPNARDVFFAGELQLDLNKSESGISFFVSIPFDNASGFKKRAK
ncbi:MAG: hypothetical protein JNL11_02610 [Bdellovibrionaceae bacterium]|nr:hypothetical protein [Pseudobdellovibrionaceae bacterium]